MNVSDPLRIGRHFMWFVVKMQNDTQKDLTQRKKRKPWLDSDKELNSLIAVADGFEVRTKARLIPKWDLDGLFS